MHYIVANSKLIAVMIRIIMIQNDGDDDADADDNGDKCNNDNAHRRMTSSTHQLNALQSLPDDRYRHSRPGDVLAHFVICVKCLGRRNKCVH